MPPRRFLFFILLFDYFYLFYSIPKSNRADCGCRAVKITVRYYAVLCRPHYSRNCCVTKLNKEKLHGKYGRTESQRQEVKTSPK